MHIKAERRNDGGSWIKSSGGSASQSSANMWTISHHKEIASFKVVKEVEIKVEYLIGDENG